MIALLSMKFIATALEKKSSGGLLWAKGTIVGIDMPKFEGDVLLAQHNCRALHPRAGLKANQKVCGH